MSDETMRKAGRAELDRLNAGAKKAAETPKPKKKPRHEARSFGDLVGIGKAKERRVGEKGQTVSDAVDEAVKGAKSEY
jgi:hypothetical protein